MFNTEAKADGFKTVENIGVEVAIEENFMLFERKLWTHLVWLVEVELTTLCLENQPQHVKIKMKLLLIFHDQKMGN